ncbi:MAG: hypothetical protein MK212_11335 [Saprospiraceae bacterium]|nr:hypothetical protein [Saprospiraceae bacterium]
MLVDYKELDAQSKVWIYQSNKLLSEAEVQTLKKELNAFLLQWTSHNQTLRTWGDILHGRFIIIMVDERFANASGCSIDKSVAFMKSVEQSLDIDLFDRWNFAYQTEAGVEAANKSDFAQLYAKGEINDTTFVFNNLVKNKDEFEQKWRIPLKDSWHKRMV